MITRYFQLQLNAGSALPPVINVNQYDSGETWVFTLYQEDGTVYQPSSGSIVGVKADGNAIANAGTVDADGRVVITETQQMTAVAGKVDCELTLDSGTHGTLNFVLQVEADPVDGAVVSASDLSLISQGIQAAEDARTALGSMAPTNVGTSGQFLMRNATTSEWSDLPDRSSDDVVFSDSETLTQKVTAMQSDINGIRNELDTVTTVSPLSGTGSATYVKYGRVVTVLLSVETASTYFEIPPSLSQYAMPLVVRDITAGQSLTTESYMVNNNTAIFINIPGFVEGHVYEGCLTYITSE